MSLLQAGVRPGLGGFRTVRRVAMPNIDVDHEAALQRDDEEMRRLLA